MSVNRIASGAAACCAVLLVAACGGGTAATGNAAPTPTTTAAANGTDGGGAGSARAFPGATGLLAQITGTTLQVQGTDAQTAVTYSATTTFTNTVAAKSSDVVVGACVQARSARPAAGSDGATPTAAPGAAGGPIVASTVEISAAVNGKCTAGGAFGMPGTRLPGAAGAPTRPTGVPNPGRTRGQGGGGFGGLGGVGLGAFGKVTAVSSAGFTLESIRAQNGTATTAAPTMETVKTPAGTTFTRTGTATAKALALGLCVTALGKADDTGSIAATSIILRPAENGSCSSGFGGGFGRGGPGSGAAPTGGSAGA